MKSFKILKSTYLLLFIEIFLLLKIPFNAVSQDTSSFSSKIFKDTISKNCIHEERFIKINGIEQWVTIKGERSKPVILFLHGGLIPLSPYSDAIYGGWEKDFILVQWDQRGAGRTYGYNAPEELSPEYLKSNPLTVEQMTDDGIELSKYLISYLGKEKIIILGTSWGSILGVKMAIKCPDLFSAYVGHSQVVNPIDNLAYDYSKVYKFAQNDGDKEVVDTLNSIGLPPYDSPKNAGKLFKIIKKYEKRNAIPAPDSWWKPSIQYDNAKDSKYDEDGDDYWFINYMGYKGWGVKSMASTINLFKDGIDFKIPVFLIQGEEDILTPKEITKEYFDKIKAPKKEFILLPKTAHNFSQISIDMQFKVMKEFLLPIINK